MIFSKGNLSVVEVTKTDKAIPALDNVHLKVDGSTIGSNGTAVMAVSPVNGKIAESVPLEDAEMLEDETVSSETVKEILKNMPRDTLFKGILEHCNFAGGKFKLTDGKRKREIAAKTYPRQYVNYKAVFERVGRSKVVVRSAVNLRRLIAVLETINKICPDSAKNQAVYLEFTDNNDVVIRSENAVSSQRVCAVLKAYSGAEGAWMDHDGWEEGLFTSGDRKKIKKIRKIRKVKRLKGV